MENPCFVGFDRGHAGPPEVGRGIYVVSKFVSLGLFTAWSTTCPLHVCMLHYMAGNDYRRGRRQVSFVVDEGLWVAVKVRAGLEGVSVTRFVSGLLEEVVGGGGVGGGSVDFGGPAASGVVVGSQRGGDCGGDFESGVVGRGLSVWVDPIGDIA